MMNLNDAARPRLAPILDPDYIPAKLWNDAFLRAVQDTGKAIPLTIALERNDNQVAVFKTKIFPSGVKEEWDGANFFYVERLVKSLLWTKGGWKITVGGCKSVGERLKQAYESGGMRKFDADFMTRVYEKDFTVVTCDYDQVPQANERTQAIGGHLDGCRIGFDAGGSDRKVSAVMDGEVLFSDETVWHPKITENPDYHFEGILDSLKRAAEHLPRVDAIGVSSAGIYINNRTMVASLFLKVPQNLFNEKVKDIYPRAAKAMGDVPIVVVNDGDVTALAGAASLKDTNILGIAMGTSEAVGYVNREGHLTGWLNELAFMPVDYNPNSMIDEWSGDYGCGVKYFSQDSVIKLAPAAGIDLDESFSPAEKLTVVQKHLAEGHEGAKQIFESMGYYLGYAIAHYADFYDIKHVLILGRVTSGQGGTLMLEKAREVLDVEFPDLAKIKLSLPDESDRRVGQSIAAAGLPEIK